MNLLQKIGNILSEYGIKNVYCKGNVYQRDKAIREFNMNDNIKVIMLSSDSAASGINLTKAKRVVFVDQIYGSYEYRYNTRWQAIGRVYRLGQVNNVKVVQFIIKNTIEEEIYENNVAEDKKHNCSFDINKLTEDNDIFKKTSKKIEKDDTIIVKKKNIKEKSVTDDK